MLHFYRRPEDAGTLGFHYKALPKRAKHLQLGSDIANQLGWGLRYKEEVSWGTIAIVEGLIGAFSLIWFMSHSHDLTVASPPSALAMAFGGIILTLMKEVANRNLV